ncbi:CRAL-TRIO domain-containing protein [Gorgonomyces haynaldii]|nr:CRAL-TRIO domain-containing protein [Gorgonomyces haynaldii]
MFLSNDNPPPIPEQYPLNGLTKEQIHATERLLNKSKPLANDAMELEWMNEACCVRYLKATKWNEEHAFERLQKTLVWRRSYRPWEITPEEVAPEAETGKQVISGFDYEGRPLFWLIPRLENTKTYERQMRYVVYNLEKLLKVMPKGVEKMTIIIDYENLSMMTAPPLSVTKHFLQVVGDHYPERMGNLFFLNPSWYLWVLFPLVRPFIDPVTAAKFHFVDLKKQKTESHTKSEVAHGTGGWTNLFDHVDPKYVFKVYGGDFDFEWNFDTYWEAITEIS